MFKPVDFARFKQITAEGRSQLELDMNMIGAKLLSKEP